MLNKIIVSGDQITLCKIDSSIDLKVTEKTETFTVNSIKIKVLKNTNLEINYTSDIETKIDIFINILDNAVLNLTEIKTGKKIKTQYKYYLEENSVLNVTKINDSESTRELCLVNLNGYNSSINYILKTIAKNEEKYDMMVYHNHNKTVANIENSGLNIQDGKITFNTTNYVPKDKKECIINQNSKIVTFNSNKCLIQPNLMIDEYDVSANHSAFIGKFDLEEVFYLQTRGLSLNEANMLLIKGFLLNNLDESLKKEMTKHIKKYWR